MLLGIFQDEIGRVRTDFDSMFCDGCAIRQLLTELPQIRLGLVLQDRIDIWREEWSNSVDEPLNQAACLTPSLKPMPAMMSPISS